MKFSNNSQKVVIVLVRAPVDNACWSINVVFKRHYRAGSGDSNLKKNFRMILLPLITKLLCIILYLI